MANTVGELIDQYCSDPQSSFSTISYSVRIKHQRLLARIVREHGKLSLQELRVRDLIVLHKTWLGNGKIATAHAMITRLRVVFRFGATILEDQECRRLVDALGEIRFEKPSLRDQKISSEQAKAIRVKAHIWFGWYSIALVQALVPVGEPSSQSDVKRTTDRREEKWVSGLRWSDLDENFILRPMFGRSRQQIEFDLRTKRMIMEELALYSQTPISKLTRCDLPVSGPMVCNDTSGLPFSTSEFRRKWRKVADRAGIPKNITNKDSNKLASSKQ
jgi:hypothetical protein